MVVVLVRETPAAVFATVSGRQRAGAASWLPGRFAGFERRPHGTLARRGRERRRTREWPGCRRRPGGAWPAAGCACSRPARSAKRGATSANRIRTACLSPSSRKARRRAIDHRRDRPGSTACHLSLLRQVFQASRVALGRGGELVGLLLGRQRRCGRCVMHCSTSGRTSLAFSSVVMMRPLTLGLLSSSSASRSVRNRLLARFAAGPADGSGSGRACGLFVDVAWQSVAFQGSA